MAELPRLPDSWLRDQIEKALDGRELPPEKIDELVEQFDRIINVTVEKLKEKRS